MNTSHFENLKQIIGRYLPQDVEVHQVHLESDLIKELNINSAHLVDIVLDVEDFFDIRVENEDMEKLKTVSDALRMIEEKLAT